MGLSLGASIMTASAMRAGSRQGAGASIASKPERLVQMQHHFVQAALVQEALIRGDLDGIREPATQLAQLPTPSGLPGAALPFLEETRHAAARAASARTEATAATATASLLAQCGECHRAAGVFIAPAVAGKPNVGGIVGHMLEHQRAVDELLEGLIAPSASAWRDGASRLATAELGSVKLPSDLKMTSDVRKIEARVHQLASQAAAASDASARIASYAQVIATCAECHGIHSRIWGPGRGRGGEPGIGGR
jgi:mono/diheme cytochrome c family protein